MPWDNLPKSSTTFDNQTPSSADFSNQAKNDATFTKQSLSSGFFYLLQEIGFYLLQENGHRILLQESIGYDNQSKGSASFSNQAKS